MKKIVVLLMLIVTTFIYSEDPKSSDGKFIFGGNMKASQDTSIDINALSKEKLLAAGISSSYVNKIVEYRDLTGGFLEVSELKRISGIGEKTYEKLAPKFRVESKITKKKISINKLEEKKLPLFGFTSSEIKNIMKYRKEKGKISSNMDLMEILSKSRYEEYRDLVEYSY